MMEHETIQVLEVLVENVHIAIDIAYIQKALHLTQLERMPGSAFYVAGLLNLGGKSVPVIDLALRLGLNRNEMYSLDMPILICAYENKILGLLVDKTLGLNLINQSELQMQQEFKKSSCPFAASIKLNDHLALLLNIKNIFSLENEITKENAQAIAHDVINRVTSHE